MGLVDDFKARWNLPEPKHYREFQEDIQAFIAQQELIEELQKKLDEKK